tara:strand:+ start:278 stop:835 length:558 start_codon:yes stop_codon:yes gene_type:complete
VKGSLVNAEIAEPYTQAMMSIAESHKITRLVEQDCKTVLQILKDSSELRAFISSPVIKDEDKKSVLNKILGKNTHQYFRNFVMLLIEKRRIALLEATCQRYIDLARKLTNTVLAKVTVTTEISEEQRSAISDKIKGLTGAESVEMEIGKDPDLIGGFIIKIGSQVFDASLRGQLRRISVSLSGTL